MGGNTESLLSADERAALATYVGLIASNTLLNCEMNSQQSEFYTACKELADDVLRTAENPPNQEHWNVVYPTD